MATRSKCACGRTATVSTRRANGSSLQANAPSAAKRSGATPLWRVGGSVDNPGRNSSAKTPQNHRVAFSASRNKETKMPTQLKNDTTANRMRDLSKVPEPTLIDMLNNCDYLRRTGRATNGYNGFPLLTVERALYRELDQRLRDEKEAIQR